MSPAWTPTRQAQVRRRKDGSFKSWPGGKPDNRDSSAKGLKIHMDAMFRRLHERPSRVGDVVRMKNRDGTFHQQSWWYVKTEFGWRRSKTAQVKPTAAEVKDQIKRSRPGGKRR